jgi:pSer/pThr/pTyr-binding forkhead associated (FHA) protein
MIDGALDQLIVEGWLFAVLRVLFIGLVYLFLFLVFRATVRELHAAALKMPSGEGHADRVSLVVLDAAASSLVPGSRHPLQAETDIGRGAESTIVVDDPHVSARHAQLHFARGRWWLRDLGSSNGTLLNGEPVRSVVGVRPGDVIQCGGVQFRLVPSFPVPGEDFSA